MLAVFCLGPLLREDLEKDLRRQDLMIPVLLPPLPTHPLPWAVCFRGPSV